MDRPEPTADGGQLVAAALTKRFGPVQALSSLSLRIQAGAIVALVGPNGAGKTTLLRTWMGFERPNSGRVLVSGLDPWADRRAIHDVAFLAQQPSLYRELRVSEHLDLIGYLRSGFDQAGAADRLASLGIRADARIDELSGGEVAQVGLAIAIGLRASVILLDEPLASLDPLAREEFLELLARHGSSSGATIVISSHAIAELESVCTDLLILGRGQVILHESIRVARERHWVGSGSGDSSVGHRVARLPGVADFSVYRAEEQPFTDARHATIHEITVAYLSAARADA